MRTLHLEELEPRQLLNGTSLAFQPSPYAAPMDTGPAPVAEHSPFTVYGGSHGAPAAWRMSDGDRAPDGPTWVVVRPGNMGSGQGGFASAPPATQISGTTSPAVSPSSSGGSQEASASSAPAPLVSNAASLVGPASPGTSHEVAFFQARVSEIETITVEGQVVSVFRIGTPPADAEAGPVERLDSVRTSPSATTAAPLDTASPGRGTTAASPETVAGMSAVWFNAAPSPRVDNGTAVAVPRTDGQGLSVARGTVWAVHEAEGLLTGAEALLRSSPASLPRAEALPVPSATDGEQAEEGLTLALPLAPLPGVLTVLPAFDLPAVERGMQHFLGQLERMGQGLGIAADDTGWHVWMIAGIAAATACEFARRQLRNPEGAPEVGIRWNTGSPPGGSFGT